MQDNAFPRGRLIGVSTDGDSVFVGWEGDTVFVPRYNPFSGDKASARKAAHVLYWTPQYVWIGFSCLALFVLVVSFKKSKVLWLVIWVPYLMVLTNAAALWPYGGHPQDLAVWRAMFWENAAPTVAALRTMAWVYLFLVPALAFYQWWRKHKLKLS